MSPNRCLGSLRSIHLPNLFSLTAYIFPAKAMTRKRIIISTFGSFGDLHPYMSLAMELQSRGHEPVIATMEHYREKIEGAGLSFAPVRPNFQHPKEQDPELIAKILNPKT